MRPFGRLKTVRCQIIGQAREALSPDNRWIAYASDESGRSEIYVRAFSQEGTGSERKSLVSGNGGYWPKWRRDGKELLYLDADSVGRPPHRLLPNYSYFLTVKDLAHSTYHALQLKADSRQIRRLGLQFGANYTWSHSIDNASAMDGETGGFSNGIVFDRDNLRLDRGNSSFDQTHRFVTHFIWQVPAVRSGLNLLNHLATGWQVSGILSFQTGQPFHLYDLGTVDRDFVFSRPRLTGPLPRTLGAAEMIAAPSAFNQFLYLPANLIRKDRSCIANATPFACLGSIYDPLAGTLPRNIYRRPGSYYQDIAFGRIIRVRESVRVQLRAEFYNLNHPNLEVTGSSRTNGIDLNRPTFAGGTASGVVASHGATPRQVVMAVNLLF